MKENDFNTDTTLCPRTDFIRRIKVPLIIAAVLTGICFFSQIFGIAASIKEQVWDEYGTAVFAEQLLLFACTGLIFVSLVKIMVDRKPFSQIVTWCIRMIGVLLMAAAFLLPRLEGYRPSGFDIISSGDFVLIDGIEFLPGMLLIILSSMIKAGFAMQREIDEIL